MSKPAPYITAYEAMRCLRTGELLTEAEWRRRGQKEIEEASARAQQAFKADPSLTRYVHASTSSSECVRLKQEMEEDSDRLVAAVVEDEFPILSGGFRINKDLLSCDVVILGNQLFFRDPEQRLKHDPKMDAYPNLRILRSKFEAWLKGDAAKPVERTGRRPLADEANLEKMAALVFAPGSRLTPNAAFTEVAATIDLGNADLDSVRKRLTNKFRKAHPDWEERQKRG